MKLLQIWMKATNLAQLYILKLLFILDNVPPVMFRTDELWQSTGGK